MSYYGYELHNIVKERIVTKKKSKYVKYTYKCSDGTEWKRQCEAVARQRAINLQDVLAHIPSIMDKENPYCPRAFDVRIAMKVV